MRWLKLNCRVHIILVAFGKAVTNPYESIEFTIGYCSFIYSKLLHSKSFPPLHRALYFCIQNRSGLPIETIATAMRGEAVWQAQHRIERQRLQHCKEQCSDKKEHSHSQQAGGIRQVWFRGLLLNILNILLLHCKRRHVMRIQNVTLFYAASARPRQFMFFT